MGKFLTDVDLNQNELQYAVIQNLNTDPIVSTTGQIYYNANISKLRLKTLAGWVTISTGTITIPTLQQVVDSGNSISNFGGIGTADILSVNFTNNRSLYLNNSSSPTIKIVDNLNASHYTIFDIDTLNLNGAVYNWSSIVNPATSPLSALPFTTDHLTATNNQYIIGDLVWYLGNVYRCIANNDSLLPTNTSYWTNLGIGYSLVQQPSDWNATSGNNQILNKPTIPSVTPAALTKTDDTNVILTLGGTPTTALLQGVSLTVGWTGTLADARIASAAYWNAKQNAITTGTTLQYFRGDLSLATFPTIPTVGTWGALNYPTWTTGTPFVKMTAAGTFALDTTTYTPASRTLTINGTTYDLSADRSWTIAAGVTSVSATSPMVSTGGTSPTISIPQATNSANGYLSSTDWTTFNNKQNNLKTFNRTQGIYYFEEFMGNQAGSLGASYSTVITLASGNGTVRTVATTNRTNQQGIIQHQTGTGATNFAGYLYGGLGTNGTLYIGSGTISLETYTTVETLSTVTERFHTIFGYYVGSNYSTTANAIFFSYDEAGTMFFEFGAAATPNWKCYTRGAGVTTRTNTSIPVVAGTWYKLRIDINAAGNSVTFYIDGTLVATHTTNIPTSLIAMNIISLINKTAGTTARSLLTDYFMYEEIFTNPR